MPSEASEFTSKLTSKQKFVFGLFIIFIILVVVLPLVLLKNKENFTLNNTKVKIVTPHFVYQALNEKNNKIILVNVLSDNLKYKMTLNGFNDKRSLSKQEFEELLKNNNNQIPKNIDKVIIYCAGWSCKGSKNYYKEMIKKGIDVNKVVDYIGAIHEWSTYAYINPSIFTFHSTENEKLLSSKEVKNIRLNTAHDYFVDNVLLEGYIKKLSVKGKEFKQFI